MAKDKGKGLFPEPKKPCEHKNVRRNEHQKVCNDCEQTWDAPH